MRRRRYGNSDDDEGDGSTTASGDDDDDDDDDVNSDGDYGNGMAVRDKEEALVQSALRRISRARARGKADVRLNKEELAALERRRQRMREEEERRRRSSGSGSDRKKRREPRIAVPLSHLEPVSRKETAAQPHPPRQDSLPRHVSAGDVPEGHDGQVYPPIGYFPPLSASRNRQRSGTGSSRPPSGAHDERGSSPFQYDYVAHPSASRHVSDSAAPPRSSRGSSGSRSHLDPLQYQTAGPQVPHAVGAAASYRRYVSGPAEMAYDTRRWAAASGPRRQSYGEETEGETSEESANGDGGNGAQTRGPRPGESPARGRDVGIVAEASPEREREPSKKKSSSSPPAKKNSGSGGRRRKK